VGGLVIGKRGPGTRRARPCLEVLNGPRGGIWVYNLDLDHTDQLEVHDIRVLELRDREALRVIDQILCLQDGVHLGLSWGGEQQK